MNPAIIIQLLTAIPSLIKAVETILQSDQAKTIEDAVKMLINHNTPGQQNVAALNG